MAPKKAKKGKDGKPSMKSPKIVKVAKPVKTKEGLAEAKLKRQQKAQEEKKERERQINQREKARQQEKARLTRTGYEQALGELPRLDITIESMTRTFLQERISGAGYRCLWRSIARDYYGTQNAWDLVLQRAQELYRLATQDGPRLEGSALQTRRRWLYETIAEDGGGGFRDGLRDGTWGTSQKNTEQNRALTF